MDELSREECYQLLSQASVGRMGLRAEDVQIIHPVNFATDGESIVVRTGAASLIALHAPMAPVAFEVDHIDEQSHSGWSVVLQGIAHDVSDDIDVTSENLRKLEVSPWAGGDKPVWLKVTPQSISGRRIS